MWRTFMRTVVISGLVSGVASPRRRSGGYPLALGEPPVFFYSPGAMGDFSLRHGEFVAIAGRRTSVPGAKYVALAYRRLGVESSGQSLGAGWPLLCVGFGIVGAYLSCLGALQEPRGLSTFVPMTLLGVFGIVRLVSMWHAVQLLNRMEMPPTTRSCGP